MTPLETLMKRFPRWAAFAGAAVILSLLPDCVWAAPDFQVSTRTGLETDAPTTAKPKKARVGGAPAPNGPTVITCSAQTTFDEKTRMAVFEGDVSVKSPQFVLTAEKLTAYLKKDETPAKTDVEPTKNARGEGSADSTGGLEKAIAEGNVVISQTKTDEKGEETQYVGRGAKAVYTTATGDIVLSGWPQIQQGMNNQVATEEGTVMILNRDGRLKTVGRSKTIIEGKSGNEKNGKSAPSTQLRTAQ